MHVHDVCTCSDSERVVAGGELTGGELHALCEWVFEQYHPPGAPEAHLDQAHIEQQAEQLLKQIDRDGDGKVSFAEFKHFFSQDFVNVEM